MSWEKRVVWSEGMLLQPHHFQQQARYVDAQLRNGINSLSPFFWGFTDYSIDHSLLKTGKFCLNQAQGILDDGTLFRFPLTDSAPEAISISQGDINATVYLAVSIRRHGNNEFNREQQHIGRYQLSEHEVNDVSGTSSEQTLIEVTGLNFSLRTSNQDNSEFSCLAVAVIDDVTPNGAVSLRTDFVPTLLNCKKSTTLTRFISELVNMQQNRIQSLVARVSIAGNATVNDITDFIMLQTLNRHLPGLLNLDTAENVPPFHLYEKLIAFIGDLSTLIQADKQVPPLPVYGHSQLTEVFMPLMETLRNLLSVVLEQNAINIPLQDKKFGIRVGKIADRTLLESATFVIAVGAECSTEELRQYFPSQVKIGSVEAIKELVNLQLPGIQLTHLAAAPREIPYHRHFVYFELVKQGEYWDALLNSGGIACHVGTSFPKLKMELWAMRS